MIYDTMSLSVTLMLGGKPHTFGIEVEGKRETLQEPSISGISGFSPQVIKDLIVRESNAYFQRNGEFDTDIFLEILMKIFAVVKQEVDITVNKYIVRYLGYKTVLEV